MGRALGRGAVRIAGRGVFGAKGSAQAVLLMGGRMLLGGLVPFFRPVRRLPISSGIELRSEVAMKDVSWSLWPRALTLRRWDRPSDFM